MSTRRRGPSFARPRRCAGFALLTVVFLMLVLSLLAAYLADGLAGRHASAGLSALVRQAEHAAASGLEWGRARALTAGLCGAAQVQMAGFAVDVQCAARQVEENGATYELFDITAEARHGVYGAADFVRRSAHARYADR